jgi:hypothetical protein
MAVFENRSGVYVLALVPRKRGKRHLQAGIA